MTVRLSSRFALTLLLVGVVVAGCGPATSTAPPPGSTSPARPSPVTGRRCGDGICDGPENAQNCPRDCGEVTVPPPTVPPAKSPVAAGRCGDGVCDGPENAQNCPQDCAPAEAPTVPKAPNALPLYVTIYYHVEPNPQLFDRVEPGYFEGISKCIRDMSSDLAAIDLHATFCFAWLYNDLVYCRNHDPQTGEVFNSPRDTGIETYEQVLADGHELAYHSHPPMSFRQADATYYARPNEACDAYSPERHRWTGPGKDDAQAFYPGVYQFDDPADPWYGRFTWEPTSESLFLLAGYLGATVRHTNGGQRPSLDITNEYGSGINHEESIAQLRSLMGLGFDLISPEVMPFFHTDYAATGSEWTDLSTFYAAYFGPENNVQIYYPDIDGRRLERAASANQGLTFMPVQRAGQLGWKGTKDDGYYDPQPLGGTGYGGIRWKEDNFYLGHSAEQTTPWSDTPIVLAVPSMAEQFNNAMQRHLNETPSAVNAWGFNFHIVNVLRADLAGLSDNWENAVRFYRDIADGVADGVINEPRPDLVQFVTMQELSAIYDRVASGQAP